MWSAEVGGVVCRGSYRGSGVGGVFRGRGGKGMEKRGGVEKRDSGDEGVGARRGKGYI